MAELSLKISETLSSTSNRAEKIIFINKHPRYKWAKEVTHCLLSGSQGKGSSPYNLSFLWRQTLDTTINAHIPETESIALPECIALLRIWFVLLLFEVYLKFQKSKQVLPFNTRMTAGSMSLFLKAKPWYQVQKRSDRLSETPAFCLLTTKSKSIN